MPNLNPRIALDTNVRGSVVSGKRFRPYLLSRLITSGKIAAFISEAALSLELVKNEDRIDKYIRDLSKGLSVAEKTVGQEIQLFVSPPQLPTKTVNVDMVNRALALGIKVLRMPRIMYGSAIALSPQHYAGDTVYTQPQRQSRTFQFIRAHPNKDPDELKSHGTHLAGLHGISPPDWKEGLLAELDAPMRFDQVKGHLLGEVQRIISEWADTDALASCFGYGVEYFCTEDISRSQGPSGILHPSNRQSLLGIYDISVVSLQALISDFRATRVLTWRFVLSTHVRFIGRNLYRHFRIIWQLLRMGRRSK